jgi:acyl-CoA synthetase (AMP-forming)/AMP-acid ligase II
VKENKASGFFLFEAAAQRHGKSLCIWSRQTTYTWSESYERVCQYGHYFLQLGVTPHQFVGVYLYNAPEFMFIWLGLLSIGAAPALINYNLASTALVHCVKLSGTSVLICDGAPECASRIEEVKDRIMQLGVNTMVLSEELKTNIAQYPITRPRVDCFKSDDKFLPFALMYTRYVLQCFLNVSRLIRCHKWDDGSTKGFIHVSCTQLPFCIIVAEDFWPAPWS